MSGSFEHARTYARGGIGRIRKARPVKPVAYQTLGRVERGKKKVFGGLNEIFRLRDITAHRYRRGADGLLQIKHGRYI
ncbi:hypothetical protein [Paraburkholderia caffeinilytica]|uniref:hypothetical protein n=1 Tax=Paraburkholderia caffeinilytica TaxID=1761016 RepID=UPI0038B90DA2